MPLLPTTLATNRALNFLAGLSRADVVCLATSLADVPWMREAFRYAKERDISVLGRFHIEGPMEFAVEGKRPPWPAVIVRIRRRPRGSGQMDRAGLVAVYANAEGQWECSCREVDRPPWGQYAGNRSGEPSVFNGDRPGDVPDALEDAHAGSLALPEG